MRKPIVVVGSVNLDLVSKGKKIPAPGETVRGESFQTFNGGKGANQAVAAARLGYPVSMIAKVGGDDFGARLRGALEAEKIDVAHVGTAASLSSGVAMISVDEKGQNSITVVPGANDALMPADLDACRETLRAAGMILAQLEIPLETVERLSQLAAEFGVPMMLDPAPARPIPQQILKRVTYLTPNETETLTLCGITKSELDLTTAAECAKQLQAQGVANVVIKMGSRGAYVTDASGAATFVPTIKVAVVDSTAAGDAFNGAFASALLSGKDLLQAVRYAAAAGAVSVTRAGAQPAMPAAAEVEALLAQNGQALKEPEMVKIGG
ncbi:MAG: ribokinase [Acidobacteriaceae bacterium]|nr:ribokinase [Acidobacteriaceae bacterium]